MVKETKPVIIADWLRSHLPALKAGYSYEFNFMYEMLNIGIIWRKKEQKVDDYFVTSFSKEIYHDSYDESGLKTKDLRDTAQEIRKYHPDILAEEEFNDEHSKG